MRRAPTVLHLDMDAFYAAVEQAAKPSLRGKPVIVGGLGPRGVVATASYEARPFGVHSAMPMAQARRLCPNAAYLTPRFGLYRQVSDVVMGLLRELSPLVEPLSLDEAFVDLQAGDSGVASAREALAVGERLRRDIRAATGLSGSVGLAGSKMLAKIASEQAKPDGLVVIRPGTERALLAPMPVRTLPGVGPATAQTLRRDIRAATGLSGSVGLAGSKMLAKIASEQAKPDGLVVIRPGTERALLAPMPVRTLPGVGPATAQTLRRAGVTTVGEIVEAGEAELVRLLGRAHGTALYTMAQGIDERPVVAERDAKSISVEDTFDIDLTDRTRIHAEIARLAERCVERLRKAGRSGRTVVVKVRNYDFSTLTRSETLRGPTDDPVVVKEAAARLVEGVDTTSGVRLLGVGVSGLADFTQEDLFAQAAGAVPGDRPRRTPPAADGSAAVPAADEVSRTGRRWLPGLDVRHARYGPGWVQGSGLGRVTVRFEEPGSPPGRVRTFAVDDPELAPSDPLPLRAPRAGQPSEPAIRPKVIPSSEAGASAGTSSP